MIPRGYGIAYWNYTNLTAICYPLPLNFLISLCCRIYLVLKRGVIPGSREIELRKAYERGVSDGRVRAIWEKL